MPQCPTSLQQVLCKIKHFSKRERGLMIFVEGFVFRTHVLAIHIYIQQVMKKKIFYLIQLNPWKEMPKKVLPNTQLSE